MKISALTQYETWCEIRYARCYVNSARSVLDKVNGP